MDRWGVDSIFDKELVLSPKETWKTKNDFSFLKFVKFRPSIEQYALPQPSPTNSPDCFVIGYPGHIEFSKFKEDYGSELTEENIKSLYSALELKTSHFEHKIVSIGARTTNLGGTDETASCHRCPTLRGSSGGFFGILDHNQAKFAGVHIGGSKDLQNNYLIPCFDPAFLYCYMKSVSPEFFKKHQKDLQPLVEYFNKLCQKYPAMKSEQK